MIYTPMTISAMKLAYQAHQGQTDYSGVPYIFHPIHLAEQMQDEITCTAALLHDVVEDTPVTIDQLRAQFPAEVIDALALLTHDPASDYFEYVRRIRQNPTARAVKLADLRHNMDESRRAGVQLPPEHIAWWKEKYSRAMAILTE